MASNIADIAATAHTNWRSCLRSRKTYWNKERETAKGNNLEAQQFAEKNLAIIKEQLLFCSKRKRFIEVIITAVQSGLNIEDTV